MSEELCSVLWKPFDILVSFVATDQWASPIELHTIYVLIYGFAKAPYTCTFPDTIFRSSVAKIKRNFKITVLQEWA